MTDMDRITKMSLAYERASAAVKKLQEALDDIEAVKSDIAALDRYQRSGKWLKDYEADEKGLIKEGVNRSVLSQDGLYNLLSDYEAIVNKKDGIFAP